MLRNVTYYVMLHRLRKKHHVTKLVTVTLSHDDKYYELLFELFSEPIGRAEIRSYVMLRNIYDIT
jgi:hypothetical protein